MKLKFSCKLLIAALAVVLSLNEQCVVNLRKTMRVCERPQAQSGVLKRLVGGFKI